MKTGWYDGNMEGHEYIVCPDGTVIWDPQAEDFVLVREEERDLLPEGV